MFRKGAAWFVACAWVLLLLTAFICFAGLVGGAAEHYTSLPPQHYWANYDRAAVHLFFLGFWVALFTAITSSTSLGSGFRAAASGLVVAAWICLVVGAALRLALVGHGPEQFSERNGPQKFLVPWRYVPKAMNSPSLSGFDVFLCPSSILGAYDEGCHASGQQRLAIRPPEAGFEYFWEDKGIWRFSKIEMKPAGVRNGYQVSIGTVYAPGLHQRQAIFFERSGSSRCLIICYFGSCRHQVLIGQRILSYDANYLLPGSHFTMRDGVEQQIAAAEVTFQDSDAIDQWFTELVDSWVVP